MNQSLFISLLISCFCFTFTAPAEVAGQGMGDRTVSPDIHSDQTVTFRYEAPEAQNVEISAEFLQDPEALSKNEAGLWSITLGPVEPDIYPYYFIVDGIRVADPNNPDIFPNERFQRSLVHIPGNSPMLHSLQDVPHGSVNYRLYHSESLDLTRPAVIYTPPGYNENRDARYPVLYLIHGMTDTEETWYKVGRIHMIMDNLIALGEAEPMIVVMPYANPYPALMKDGRDVGMNLLGTDLFRSEILNEVIPFTEDNYRVLENRENRAIAGFSLGGRQALAAGLGDPDAFSWVGAFAPAIWAREFDDQFENLYAPAEELNNSLNLLWISCGREDGLYESSEEFISMLEDKAIRHESLFTSGSHTWMNVRFYAAEFTRQLFK